MSEYLFYLLGILQIDGIVRCCLFLQENKGIPDTLEQIGYRCGLIHTNLVGIKNQIKNI